MTTPMIWTNAGFAALVNATHTGTLPVECKYIALGTGTTAAAKADTALGAEIKRIQTSGGTIVDTNVIHVVLKDESADAYSATEVGLIAADGTLLARYAQATPLVTKAAGAVALLAIDASFTDVDTTQISFGAIEFVNPPWGENTQGVVQKATQAQAEAGTDNNVGMTPRRTRDALAVLGIGVTNQKDFFPTSAAGWAGMLPGARYFVTAGSFGAPDASEFFYLTCLARDNNNKSSEVLAISDGTNQYWHGRITDGQAPVWRRLIDAGEFASVSNRGIARLATEQEAKDGSADDIIVTPAVLKAVTDALIKQASESDSGILKLATAALAQERTDDATALTPKKLVDAFGGANQLLADNGYCKLPGGLILQWGSGRYANSASVTFPIAFPNLCYAVVASTDALETPQTEVVSVANVTQIGFMIAAAVFSSGSFSALITKSWWIAIGH